jgi:hypothetical protein
MLRSHCLRWPTHLAFADEERKLARFVHAATALAGARKQMSSASERLERSASDIVARRPL